MRKVLAFFAPIFCATVGASGQLTDTRVPFDLSRHACVFQGPLLVTGASVSWGMGVSPIMTLVHASNPEGKKPAITTIATPGLPSWGNIDQITALNPATFRTVFAADLFFWDFSTADCQNVSVDNVRRFLKWASQSDVNVIVGNVPFESGPTGCSAKINDALQACRSQAHCFLVDTYSFMKNVYKTGYAVYGDRHVTAKEIRPDGLHLSTEGAVLFDEQALEQLDSKTANCEEPHAASVVTPKK